MDVGAHGRHYGDEEDSVATCFPNQAEAGTRRDYVIANTQGGWHDHCLQGQVPA